MQIICVFISSNLNISFIVFNSVFSSLVFLFITLSTLFLLWAHETLVLSVSLQSFGCFFLVISLHCFPTKSGSRHLQEFFITSNSIVVKPGSSPNEALVLRM